MASLESVGPARHRAWVATAVPALLDLELLLIDEADQSTFRRGLERAGVHVHACSVASDALVVFGSVTPHAVVIGPSLPDMAPAEVIAVMRRHGADTVLLGIGEGDAEHVGPALMAGATAVSRPYDVEEVLRKIRADMQSTSHDTRLVLGPLRLDALAHSVRVGDRELEPLPMKEFTILRCLMRCGEQVVSVEHLKAFAWADAGPPPSDNTVAVHIKRLRTRLPQPLAIVNLRGIGYRLTVTA